MEFSDHEPNLSAPTVLLSLCPGDNDNKQMMRRKKKKNYNPRGHWKFHEDEKLRQLVYNYGAHNWNFIAKNLQGRSGKSCRLRWFNQLDPKINRMPFTHKEEEKLLAAHRIHGNKWALIARLFLGRTDNAVKNHWHVITARKQRDRLKIQRPTMPFQNFNQNFRPSTDREGRYGVIEFFKLENPKKKDGVASPTRHDKNHLNGINPSLPSYSAASCSFSNQKTRDFQMVSISDVSLKDKLLEMRPPMASFLPRVEEYDDNGDGDGDGQPFKHKYNVPFIDFLGVGLFS